MTVNLVQNPGDSDEVLPAGGTVVIGVNEISPEEAITNKADNIANEDYV